MDKKVFRSGLILVIEGRLFIIFLLFSLVFILGLIIETIIEKNFLGTMASVAFLLLELYFFKIYVLTTLFPLAFGKLIITSTGIKYRCLFSKSIFIPWENCNFCGIESYKSDIKDVYKTGRRYIFFSEYIYPNGNSGKIDKMKNNKTFIKFFPVTIQLCEAILSHKTFPQIRHFVIQNSYQKGNRE